MAYDPLAESVALIARRCVVPVNRLSRRRRFAAMAVDVAGDVAVTMFARRGVGCVWKETHSLALRGEEWTLFGGSGGTWDDSLLADRPHVLPGYLSLVPQPATNADPGVMVVMGGGATRLDGDVGEATGARPSDERWINHSEVWVNAQVTYLELGDRQLLVPWHGRVVVAWSDGPPPRVVAHDAHGAPMGEAQLGSAS